MPKSLPPHLITRLASLSGEREGVAEVSLSILPEEDLALLIQHKIIEPIDLLNDEYTEAIVISDHGRRVIAACAD